jgi:glycine/D-amino acid oxidase-like deaminating enzyme
MLFTSQKNFDVAIIGSGIVGAACAWECSRARMNVALIDRGPVGGGTTAAGMGHIVVMDDSEAQFALTSLSQRIWRELARDLPDDVEYDECGTLWAAADEEEMTEVRRKHEFYAARRVPTQILDGAQVAAAEPNLRPGLAGGLRVPNDSVIYPPTAARYFLERATDRRTKLFFGSEVTKIAPGEVSLANGTKIPAGIVVVACGPWSTKLVEGIPVKPRKGHLAITDRYPKFVRHQIVELGYLKSAHSVSSDSVAFNIQPRATGQMLIGSSRQYGAEGTEVDYALLRRMLARAQEYLPGIGKLSVIRVWTGHRAATPDKLPLIGPSLVHEKIWLATGHEGLGITTSTGTARLLVDQLLKRKPSIPFEPYLPSRFANAKEDQHG